jgi:tape measure domain-containing protein
MQVGQLEIQLLANVAKLQKDMDKAVGIVDRSSKSIASAARLASTALASVGAGISLREISNLADQYTKLTAQLKLATRSADEYAQAYANVKRIATGSQTDISATAVLYARLSNSLRDLNYTQNQVSDISESISLALRVNGATAAETASAMLQLSQAFGSGRLAGEEFRAVSESAPGLLRQLSKELGVAYGELKQMAADGKLTADVLARAFTNPEYLAGLRNQVKEVATVSSAFVVLKNNVLLAVGEIDKATGASSGFAKIMIELANSKAIRIPFETLAVLGANVVYVFKQIGNEIGGIAAQAAALFSGDFAGVKAIRQEMVKDAQTARAEIDRVNQAILNPAATQGGLVSATGTIASNAARAAADTDKAAKKTSELMKWYESENKRIQDEIRDRAKEDEDYRKDVIEDYVKANLKALKEIEDAEEEKRKRNQKASDEYLADVKRKQEAIVRENERMADNLQRSLTDAILRGFESGKGFAENFKDTLINIFKTLVLRPVIEAITSPFAKAFSGIGASLFGGNAFAGESLVASGGGIGNVFGTIREGLSSLNTNVVGSIEKLGVFLSNGNGGLADKIGGFFGQYSSQIATSLSFAPAIFSLLKGDFKGAAFQGGGAAIGTLLGGPVGGAIGSFLGGALGSAFGGKKKNPRNTTAMTSVYGANGLISSGQVNAAGKDTNMFAGSLTQLNNQFAKALGSVYEMFDQDIKRLQIDSVFSYKKGKQTIGHTTGKIDGKFFGFGAEGFGEDISQGFAAFAQKMMGRGLATALMNSSLPIEVRRAFNKVVSSSVIQAIVNSFANLNGALTVFEGKLEVTNLQLIAAAQRTGMVGAKLAEVINGFAGDLTNFYNLYYTDAEKITDINKALTKEFAKIGVTLPASKEAFRLLVEGVDTTTIAGQDLFTTLLKISPAFAQYIDAMNQQDEALQNQTDSLKALAAALDPNMFKTLVDYTRAQRYQATGIPLSNLPSYDVGTSFVPETGPAMIHRGERILTAAENREYSAQSSMMTGQLINEIRALRADIRSGDTAIAIATQKSAKILDKFDREGILLAELDNDGNAVVVPVEIVA